MVTSEKFNVPGVSCQHCVHAVTDEVAALPGVQRVLVDLLSKTVTVDHDEDTTSAQIVTAINEAGYDEVAQLN